jgi:predicted ABC-type ATPase
MIKTLYILRAVSGAGKTTLAKVLEESLHDCIAFAADDYHYDTEGNYNFELANLGKAHVWCKGKVDMHMYLKVENIVVHNTNTSEREVKPYIDMAELHGYKVVSLIVENRHGNTNVHNVPDEVLKGQVDRLRNSIKFN